jgi:hypothetical protein
MAGESFLAMSSDRQESLGVDNGYFCSAVCGEEGGVVELNNARSSVRWRSDRGESIEGGGMGKQVAVDVDVRGGWMSMEEVCTADCVRHVNALRAKRGGEPERNTYSERKNVVKHSVVYDSELRGKAHNRYRLNNDENISDSQFPKSITVLVEDAEDGGARRKFSILMENVVYIMYASINNQKCRT